MEMHDFQQKCHLVEKKTAGLHHPESHRGGASKPWVWLGWSTGSWQSLELRSTMNHSRSTVWAPRLTIPYLSLRIVSLQSARKPLLFFTSRVVGLRKPEAQWNPLPHAVFSLEVYASRTSSQHQQGMRHTTCSVHCSLTISNPACPWWLGCRCRVYSQGLFFCWSLLAMGNWRFY